MMGYHTNTVPHYHIHHNASPSITPSTLSTSNPSQSARLSRTTHSRNVDTNSRERRSNIQVQVDDVALNRVFIVCQVLTVLDTRVTGNCQWENTILVLFGNKAQESQLINTALQSELVGAGLEVQVGYKSVADFLVIDAKVQSDVTEIERQD